MFPWESVTGRLLWSDVSADVCAGLRPGNFARRWTGCGEGTVLALISGRRRLWSAVQVVRHRFSFIVDFSTLDLKWAV